MEDQDIFFWIGSACIKIDAPRKVRHFHKIISTQYEETPAGSDGENYIAKCGKEQTSYYYAMYGIEHRTGNLEKAIESGNIPCKLCFKSDDPVFEISLKKRKQILAELLKTFNSPVLGEDGKNPGNCPECKSVLQVNDLTRDGGSCVYFVPLYFCNNCGYYEVIAEQHTSDY